MTACFQPRLADAPLTLTFDALNMWKIRYQNILVCLWSSQFLHLEIQAFLDHSSIANFYRHLILNRMIYNLHKFSEKSFFAKKCDIISHVTFMDVSFKFWF